MKTSNKLVDPGFPALSREALSNKLTGGDEVAGKVLAVIAGKWNIRAHTHAFSLQSAWVVIRRKDWMKDLCLTAEELDQALVKLLKSRLLKRVKVSSFCTVVQPSQQALNYLASATIWELEFVN
jgi:hypothetical protein